MKTIVITRSICVLGLALTAACSPLALLAYEAAPLSTTRAVSYVTEKSAKMNGEVNPNGTKDTYQWFEWGISGKSDVYETIHRSVPLRTSGGALTPQKTVADLTGLAPATQYFYRQIAENSRGKSIGQTIYFTTKPLVDVATPISIATTKHASYVGETQATFHGYVSPHGQSTKWWFEYGPTAAFGLTTRGGTVGKTSGPVQATAKNLLRGTTYYYRLVTENSRGKTYGFINTTRTTGETEVVSTEAPRDQYVPSTAPATPPSEARSSVTSGGTSGSWSNLPGNFFGNFLRKRGEEKAAETNGNTTAGAVEGESVTVIEESADDSFFGMLSGGRTAEVAVEPLGPEKITMHTPVEYRITARYRGSSPGTDALLKVILPKDVFYIGDNTNNELLVEEGGGGERTYVLPMGRLERGTARTVSILGMTAGSATTIPEVRARLEYTDTSGVIHAVASGKGAANAGEVTANANASDDGGILPNSFIGWLIYGALVAGAIIGIRKAKVYYERRKEEIARAKEGSESKQEGNEDLRAIWRSNGVVAENDRFAPPDGLPV